MEEIELYAEIGALMNIEEIKVHLEYIRIAVDKMEPKLDKVSEDVAGLTVKSGVWGFVAGVIPASITNIFLFRRRQMK